MLRAAGIDQRAALEAGDGVYAVAEVNIRYLRPPGSATTSSSSRPLDAGPRRHRAHSSASHAQAEPLTDARVTAAFLGPDDRPRRQPKAWVERFNQLTRRDQ